jgi:hypothetical protein
MAIVYRVSVIGILLSIFCGASVAQDSTTLHPHLDSKFYLDLGVYFPERKVDVSVDGTLSGENDEISLDGSSQAKRSDEVFALEFG